MDSTYFLNSTEQSYSWEANRFPVQEIPRILCVYNYWYSNHTSRMGIIELQTEFWCEHTYTEENHNNVMYQVRLWHLKQHTYKESQRAHIQQISNSTPTGDLQHTYRISQTARLKEISLQSHTLHLPSWFVRICSRHLRNSIRHKYQQCLHGCETWSLTLREERRLTVFENTVLGEYLGLTGSR